MKKVQLFISVLIITCCTCWSQTIEVECIVAGRAGAYITLKPAFYDESTLPKVGEQAILYIYLKDELPEGKEEGYYELFPITVLKLIPDDKNIRIKGLGDVETARQKNGIENIQLITNKQVKLIWELPQ